MNSKLVEENLNLVYYIVSREYPTYIHDEDIIQSGMLGLCQAAEAWKEQGLFSTYAGRCIRNEINQEFIRRKKVKGELSLDAKITDDGTLGESIVGEDGIAYIEDDKFYRQLSHEEQQVLSMANAGYSCDEISERYGFTVRKVQKLLRIIRLKWKEFNNGYSG